MKLTDLLKEIDGHRFDIYLNLASGFSVFLMALEDSEALRELIVKLQRQPHSTQIVVQHLTDLLEANDEPEYAHPHDAAIAGYLFALSRTDTRLAREVIDNILQTPQLWWSRRLAKYIRDRLPEDQTQIFRFGPSGSARNEFNSDTDWVYYNPATTGILRSGVVLVHSDSVSAYLVTTTKSGDEIFSSSNANTSPKVIERVG